MGSSTDSKSNTSKSISKSRWVSAVAAATNQSGANPSVPEKSAGLCY